MKKLIPLGLVILLRWVAALAQSGSQDRELNDNVREHSDWLGSKSLAQTGKFTRLTAPVYLSTRARGYMSVQVMHNQPQTGSRAEGGQYAQGSYEASFGRYEINDANTFTFHVDGALVRTLISKDLKRIFELSGKQLIVKSPDLKEHWRVAWEHY